MINYSLSMKSWLRLHQILAFAHELLSTHSLITFVSLYMDKFEIYRKDNHSFGPHLQITINLHVSMWCIFDSFSTRFQLTNSQLKLNLLATNSLFTPVSTLNNTHCLNQFLLTVSWINAFISGFQLALDLLLLFQSSRLRVFSVLNIINSFLIHSSLIIPSFSTCYRLTFSLASSIFIWASFKENFQNAILLGPVNSSLKNYLLLMNK